MINITINESKAEEYILSKLSETTLVKYKNIVMFKNSDNEALFMYNHNNNILRIHRELITIILTYHFKLYDIEMDNLLKSIFKLHFKITLKEIIYDMRPIW
jgi:hypothetical protein